MAAYPLYQISIPDKNRESCSRCTSCVQLYRVVRTDSTDRLVRFVRSNGVLFVCVVSLFLLNEAGPFAAWLLKTPTAKLSIPDCLMPC